MNSIETVFPAENREVWNYFQCLLKPIAVSNLQRCAQAAKLKKGIQTSVFTSVIKNNLFLERTGNFLENHFLKSTSK